MGPDRQSENRKHWKTIKTLSRYLWPRQRTDLKIKFLLALCFLLAAKVINVYVPFLYKGAVDALTPQGLMFVPLWLIVGYGIARVGQQAFGELRDYLFSYVAQFAQRVVGLETFQHLHQLSLKFHLERQTGGLSRVIERGTHGIQFVLGFLTFNIFPTIIEIFMVTAILGVKFGILFAGVTFGTISLYVAYTLWITNWRLKYRKAMNDKDTEANTKAIDSLLNYETVKYFGNEQHEYSRFDKALAGYERAAIKSQLGLSLLNIGQGAIIGVGLVFVMYLAALGVMDGSMTVGDFVLVNTFLMQLYMPLNFLGFVYREIKQGLVDMERMFELIRTQPDIYDVVGAPALNFDQGGVEFRDVSFRYHPERPILKHISFVLPAGKTLAIVGSSGSGKSTIARLLFRFYDLETGAIFIDGQDIKACQQATVRRAIGIVPQDTVLFNDTIFYNIHYGNPAASENDVYAAAKLAKIHDFAASLPEGYQSRVGERGLKLSGGEKQRVAIARAILKNPAILVFDEATSALDSHTEKQIQQSLDEVSKTRTTLMIAHRLSTVVRAHEILVLEQGEIVERGSHSALLAMQGKYHAMWEKQQSEQREQARVVESVS
jgi:ATP-binding cassette, subfamily B, heavy metal transporter